jgi:hypothetical protein
MPLTTYQCPHCDGAVHTDGLIDGEHVIGCGESFDDAWLAKRGWA